MKRCGRCGVEKSLAEFAWRRPEKGQRHNYCRPCHKEYRREHYLANRKKYIAKARERKLELIAERAEFLMEFFGSHPCVDCGESDPLVLEFDHLRDKEFNVSQGLFTRGWKSLISEIAKCEVVCANCHRRRTARRNGSFRVRLLKA